MNLCQFQHYHDARDTTLAPALYCEHMDTEKFLSKYVLDVQLYSIISYMYVYHSSFASLHGAINQAIKNTPIQVLCGFNGLVMILPESVLSVSTYSMQANF